MAGEASVRNNDVGTKVGLVVAAFGSTFLPSVANIILKAGRFSCINTSSDNSYEIRYKSSTELYLAGARPFMKTLKTWSQSSILKHCGAFSISGWIDYLLQRQIKLQMLYRTVLVPFSTSRSCSPTVLLCQSLGSFIRLLMVAMPLYQLLIYAISCHLRYVVSATWEIYFATSDLVTSAMGPLSPQLVTFAMGPLSLQLVTSVTWNLCRLSWSPPL